MPRINVDSHAPLRIKIDKNGCLWIERYGKYKSIFCHVSERTNLRCGDHCRCFYDPRVFPFALQPDLSITTKVFFQHCDGRVVELDGYIEERE